MCQKISKEKFEELVEIIGFAPTTVAYFDILEDGIKEEFTFDQWRDIVTHLSFPQFPIENWPEALRGMKEKAQNIHELFITLRLSRGFKEIAEEIIKILSKMGTEREWLEIFKSINCSLDSKEVKDFVVERVRSFQLPK